MGGSAGSKTLVRYRPISTSPGQFLHPTAARSEKQEGSGQREKQRRPLPAMGPSVCPVSSRRPPIQTHQIPHRRWIRLHRYRCPHTNISDSQGGAPERPCHKCVRLGQGSDSAPHFKQPEDIPRINLLLIQKAGKRGIQKVLAKPQDMRMTRADWESHRTASRCHVCDKPLEGDSVKDHCHITGKYRGAAHNACNLKLRLSPKTTTIPVVFHNLRGYDSHLLMQAISKVEGRVSCIPNNTEKYISFSLGQLRFIDSAQFLLAPLDKLVAANKPEAFQITARYEPD